MKKKKEGKIVLYKMRSISESARRLKCESQ